MTLNNRHIKKSSFTTSPAHTALRRLLSVVALTIGFVFSIILWMILKPIARGVGWLISILTLIALIIWLMTI